MAQNGFVLISTATPNSVSSVTFSSLPSGYEAFHILLNLETTASNADVRFAVNSQTSNYYSSVNRNQLANTPAMEWYPTSNGSTVKIAHQANDIIFGEFVLMNPNNTSYDAVGRSEIFSFDDTYSANASYHHTGGFAITNNTSISSVNISLANGNMSGTIQIYGMVK